MKPACLILAGIAFAISAALAGDAAAQIPPPSDQGGFEGSWYYIDPGFRIAIFISKDKTGLLGIRYHVKVKEGQEYETDAGGYAKMIDSEGHVVEVLFTGSPTGPNRIEGHYERTVHLGKGSIVASADFQMFRSESGKKLVLLYPSYKVETTDAKGRTQTTTETNLFRLFRKVSEIVVGFDELPN